MITEDRVMELFAEDNPIPSVDDLDLSHLGSPAYLATLTTRSSEVTKLDPVSNKKYRYASVSRRIDEMFGTWYFE